MRLIASLVLFGLVAAACGASTDGTDPAGGQGGADAPTATTSPGTTAPPAATATSGTTAPESTAPATGGADAPAATAPSTSTAAPEPTVTTVVELVTDRQPADPGAPVAEWVAGVNAAGWDFHRHLDGNAVSSPMSIGVAFSLSRAGASAGPAAALDAIFGFPGQGGHSAANAVSHAVAEATRGPNIVEVANELFPDDGFALRTEFRNVATAHYGATIEPVDTADGTAAAGIINDWASERTRGLIPAIVSPGAVQNQQLVLVNTVYLKADWSEPFLAEMTENGEFVTASGQSVTTPFMRDKTAPERRYVLLDGAVAVELPYLEGDLAMWLIVPDRHDGLEAVEASLDAVSLAGLSQMAQTGTVDVTMPKWEQTLPPADLFAWLCPQGFCAGAGFDGIAPGIFLSAAVHSAKVIVDEKGTEAAAATSLLFPTSVPPPPDLTVVADRPFLWAIVHRETQAVLFVGRLVNPAA